MNVFKTFLGLHKSYLSTPRSKRLFEVVFDVVNIWRNTKMNCLVWISLQWICIFSLKLFIFFLSCWRKYVIGYGRKIIAAMS